MAIGMSVDINWVFMEPSIGNCRMGETTELTRESQSSQFMLFEGDRKACECAI